MELATNQARAFSGFISQAGAGGQYTYLQLWNPVGSGKIIIVDRLEAANLGGYPLILGFYNTALATAGMNGVNMYSGAAAAAGIMRSTTNAAALSIAQFWMVRTTTYGRTIFDLPNPIRLAAGQGVHVSPNTALAIDMDLTAFWREYNA